MNSIPTFERISSPGGGVCVEMRYTLYTFIFYKKLGSAPSTKSFLISHENFAIIVLKVS